MRKAEAGGMKRLPREAPHFGKAVARRRVGHLAAAKRPAIDRIADNPMPEMRHMDPDLVRPPGLEPAFDEAGERGKTAQHRPVGGGEAAIGDDGLFLAVALRAAERRLDAAVIVARHAPQHRPVAALQVVRREHLGQSGVRALAFRRQHDAGGVLVEPVDDPRPHLAADAGQPVAAMRDQRVDERAVGLARAGMDDHAGRLVDDDQVGILVQNLQRDVLSDGAGVTDRRKAQNIGCAGADRGGRVAGHLPVLGHRAVEDQRLDAGARQRFVRLEAGRQKPVEPVGRRVVGDGNRQFFGHRITGHGIAGHWRAH